MAHISAPYTTDSVPSPFAGLGTRILNALVLIAEANPRLREVERLGRKSDVELAKMGLKREDIVRHVMRDCFYI